MKYDPISDAERLAAPLQEWTRLGFLRGFAGMRSDLGPKGKMCLPSAAFHQAAFASLNSPVGDADEKAARLAYIKTVESSLTRIQTQAIDEHYAKATKGWITDLAVGLITLVICALAWWHLGLQHPLTISLVALISMKTIIIQLVVRRIIGDAMKAFAATTTDIRLPWTVG